MQKKQISDYNFRQNMKKVLFLTGKLQSYRVPILNIIGSQDNIELTVAHSGKKIGSKDDSFKEIILTELTLKGFSIHVNSFNQFCESFDVIVAMFYIRKLSFVRLAFERNRKFKLIYWGIGVRASYNNKFDSPTLMNQVRYFLAKKADAMLFYSEFPIKKYISNGIKKEKQFVANNTVQVSNNLKEKFKRNKILFIGTLYKEKKIFQLLESYYNCYLKADKLPVLEIVGNGPEFENIRSWIEERKINSNVILRGAIFDDQKLEKLFKQSIACISPGQAGLSVLKSMAYGVPFITTVDAITGGERLNIEHNKNGILYEKDTELSEIIMDISNNEAKYLELGNNAKDFYWGNRTPSLMAQGFIDAVNYTLSA